MVARHVLPSERERIIWVELKRRVGGDDVNPGHEELRVPVALRARVAEIVELTDPVCVLRLDREYAELCRRLVVKLARKRPSPIERGQARVWAAAVIYAVGQNNFLFDASEAQYVSADQLSEWLAVPKNSMAAKAKHVRDAVRMDVPMDPEFCRGELLAEHPLAWLVEVDGVIVDARMLPVELQTEAQQRGLIPDLAIGWVA
jgi:uncharacterized protein DUF6398